MNHNKATAAKKTETARAAFHRNHREISAHMEMITKLLNDHCFSKPLEEMHWGDVGSLAKVNSDLKAIVDFLTVK